MLSIEIFFGFACGAFERCEGEYLGIKSVRVAGWRGVAEVVNLQSLELAYSLINQHRINQWAVACDAHHHIGILTPAVMYLC